jgi:hypothetical protein
LLLLLLLLYLVEACDDHTQQPHCKAEERDVDVGHRHGC